MKFTAVIHEDDGLFVSWCPEIDVASQGKTIEVALENLKEAIELYLEDEDSRISEKMPFFTFVEVSYDKAPRPSST